MTRNIGRMGETTLEFWANQQGIIANNATQDMSGWDYFLEFPLPSTNDQGGTVPLDKEDYPAQCFIQVKSTDGRPGRWSIKLDNWLRSIKTPLPAFFLILEFDNRDSCQRGYIIHVDEKYITKALRELRNISIQGKEIHKAAMYLKYNEEHAFSPLNGEGLKKAILSYINGDIREYIIRKMEFIKNVGYEDGFAKMNIVFFGSTEDSGSIQERFIDFMIGLNPEFTVDRGTIVDIRFGIESHLHDIPSGGKLRIDDLEGFKSTLRFRTLDKKKEIRVEATAYLPIGIGNIVEREYIKARISIPYIDLVIYPYKEGKASLTYHTPKLEESVRLKDVHDLATVLLMISEAEQRSESITFDITLGRHRLGSGVINASLPKDEVLMRYLNAICYAWDITRKFDINSDIEIINKYLIEQYKNLLKAHTFLFASGAVRFAFESSYELKNDTMYVVPVVDDLRIGQYRIIIGTALIGHVSINEYTPGAVNRYLFEVENIVPERSYVYLQDEDLIFSKEELIDEIVSEYEEPYEHITIEDFWA